MEKNWIEEELAEVNFNDARLTTRCLQVGKDFLKCPTASTNRASGSWAGAKGAYRFFDNEKVKCAGMLEIHTKKTADRISQLPKHRPVLVIQDTTVLNYAAFQSLEGVGTYAARVCKTKKSSYIKALLMHSSFAIREDGFPLGLLDQKLYNQKRRRKKNVQHRLPIQKKDSYRWLESAQHVSHSIDRDRPVVHVCDREADIFEFFDEVKKNNHFFLVRAASDRIIGEKLWKADGHLWEKLAEQDSQGLIEVDVVAKKKNPARKARCEVRFETVTFPAPFRSTNVNAKKLEKLKVQAIWVREVDAPQGLDPLEWMLLTNIRISSFEEALEKINYYCLRFQIETYHKILKSGCRIEENRFEKSENLKKCLTLKSIVAIRLFQLTWEGRVNPDKPCSEVLSESEWKSLYCYIHKVTEAPETPPSTQEAILEIAKLGGFLARKHDGQPGPIVIWRGWEELMRIRHMYEIFKDQMALGNKSTWSAAKCG